jgi:eukaryotic-like serine/threonine-protein kinase
VLALPPDERTAVLPSAHDAPTAVFGIGQDDRTAVLGVPQNSPTAVLGAPERRAVAPAAPTTGPTTILPRPLHGAVPVARPEPAPRSHRRHLAWYVLLVVLLAGGSAGAVAAWPTITAWIEPGPAEPPPAYPAVEGDLGTALTGLAASIEGEGLTDELTLQLRDDVLAVAAAAAVTDYPSAVTTLEVVAAHVDQAAIADQVTSDRYGEILSSIEAVRGQLETAIVDEQAELERIQAEKERIEQEQEAAENQGIFDGLRERLDQLGRDLQRQIERWTGEVAAQG